MFYLNIPNASLVDPCLSLPVVLALQVWLARRSEKIGAELGWKPEYSRLDDIVESAWTWHQQRYPKTA